MTATTTVGVAAMLLASRDFTALPAMRDGGLHGIPGTDGNGLVGTVTRRDLVRVLTRDDVAVATDVRHQLEIYGGPGRWTDEVDGGAVTISDALANETDRHVATVLAEAVRGVTIAHVSHEGARP